MGRTSTKLQPQIKTWCEWHLVNYRQYRKDIERYKRELIPSPTANYELAPRGKGGVNRSTENTTLHVLADRYIWETEKVIDAVEFTLERLREDDRKLIELVYLNRNNRYTPEGAATQLCMSKSTAYRKINSTLAFLAMELGYMPVA